MKQEKAEWYQLSIEQTFERLGASEEGLSSQEATARMARYGPNAFKIKKVSPFARFLRQFHNLLIYILLAAVATTGVMTLMGGDLLADTLVILGVVLLNVLLSFFQEGKAESALLALKKMIVSECSALRDGMRSIVPTSDLVPGDVVVLNGGDKIPADLRIFHSQEAAVDESVLTGESVPVEKHVAPLDRPNLSPGDQSCIAFSGTFLTRGSALGVVVETGEKTEFGKIAALVRHTPTHETPLQRKMTAFTKVLIIAILGVGFVNFVLGSLLGYSMIYSFLASVSLVVAAIPEMLPMIITAILALAATAMAKRNALIRKLPAAETLGCTTVICSDKTGTLTKNEMTVTRLHTAAQDYELSGVGYEPTGELTHKGKAVPPALIGEALRETLTTGLHCNNASIIEKGGRYMVIGDPTEGALAVSAAKLLVKKKLERLDEIPFDSEHMFMATLHPGSENNVIYLKGSPERVLTFCGDQLGPQGPESLDGEAVHEKAGEMARGALRVLGMAMKLVPKAETSLDRTKLGGFTFLGLQGMIDPPRDEAIEAIGNCKGAGIRTVMITGDHVLTAKAISKQLGIIDSADEQVLSGEELAVMSDEDLLDAVPRVSVFARAAPEHKLRIARQLQERGHVVAMTGDGVNDAPALKAADIGIAMGITGTEVSKEAAGMVLTDDNFATIVGAVEEGRHAWNNLEKAILYTLPTNGGQALLVLGAVLLAPFIPLFAIRLPLEPVQILWVNLLDSVFLTMPLMMEPKQRNILSTPPRDPKARIANALFLQRVVLIGLAISVPTFLVYHHFGASAVVDGVLTDPLLLTQAQTAAFWAVLMVHFGFVLSARSVHQSAFSFSPFTNTWLLFGILFSILTRLLPTFIPAVSVVFRTAPFPAEWWWVILPCLLPGFVALELHKLIGKLPGKAARN
ncbi:MAG: HAD-IC family P-type ATPase [Proteobacteria bacterium]|nr:HAD-IC family P-type ATPase [Pseudomonadota bacterium]